MNGMDVNYYKILEVTRHSNNTVIRQNYKNVSKKYHPDKNPSPDAEAMFNKVKKSYDVLMDESQRDIYNRFGEEHILFDPRHDELKLLSTVSGVYVGWGILTYTYASSVSTRACRTWIAILGILMLVIEVSLCLTQSTIPTWVTLAVTEGETVRYMHSIFPCIMAILKCIAEYLYVDMNETTMLYLNLLSKQHQKMYVMLGQLQAVIKSKNIDSVQEKIVEFRQYMDTVNDKSSSIIDTLKNSSLNPGSNYYWLVFVFLYAGIYFNQE